jgi:alpha-tubulin suppressor-like RCC1 family protein
MYVLLMPIIYLYQTLLQLSVNEKVKILKISAGVDMSMAVSTTGVAYGFGTMKGGRLGLGLSNSFVSIPRRIQIEDSGGLPVKAVDVDCGYVHSLIVGLNGTVHLCGGVGVDGQDDGQEKNEELDGRNAGMY